ncbi:KilA-N domain-containing protein [Oceanospirillum beijerinckii]|uniref:KilA-N domain-containing protein n=1 Tax=Oceanospirillum beijerinckii TaxID=64976 RepID=UPI000417A0E9|nr:KilA-N domain-containing protein [Oceanospirillum beijerinckii]
MAASLSILSKDIRMLDGLFSLNDLHKASGSDSKHKPYNFMRSGQTVELIEEINQGSDVSLGAGSAHKIVHGGKNRGTYVCKELVYSYAMWISAKFHLAVIRAFDQMTTSPARDRAIGTNGMDILSSLVDGKISHLKGKQRASAKARFWNQIHAGFDVKSGADIPESEFNNARQFISEYVLEGDYLPAEPEQVTEPQADAVFSPKRMPSGFDQRHGRLLWEQMFDCGWRIDLLWAVRWIKDHEGQTVLLEPGVSEQLQLELNSILFWNENYRNKLLDIHRMTQIGQRH